MLHWMINPGCAFVEFMGIVTPKVMLIDKTANGTLVERTYVPCPHCDALHPGLTWSRTNNLHRKNWFGYYCLNCSNIIPPLRNWLSAVLFFLASPLLKKVKQRWLAQQPARYQNLRFELPESSNVKNLWLRQGLIWGLLMFVFMTAMELGFDGRPSTLISYVLISFAFWVVLGGLGFGFFMKVFTDNFLLKKNKNTKISN